MKFIPRTTAPSKNDEHYYGTGNPYVRGGYGMPNCTAYAIGRFWEVSGELLEPLKSKGYDSTTVFYHCKNDTNSQYKNLVGQEPKIGAIACWSSVKNDVPSNKGTHGHLAAVEEILPNGDIVCSNSAYLGTNFYMKTYSKSNNYTFTTSRTYYLQGFVYPTVEFDEDKPEPTPAPTPTPSKTVDELAKEVINGKWGNGDDRKNRLTNAGYDYYAVQNRVNEILKGTTPSASTFKVGDNVVPTRLYNYNGVKLTQYDKSYQITKIDGDRVVLAANRNGKLITWAAMNIKDIKKV